MARGEGMCFMNIGKYLERAIQSADILDVKFSDLTNDLGVDNDTTYWKYLLLSISGYELYLKNYRSGFEAKNIVDQIVFDTNFPRSVLYSVNELKHYFSRLKNDRNIESFDKINFMIGRLCSKVQFSNVQMVSEVGLHTYLEELKKDLNEVGKVLTQLYFAYS